MAKYETRAKSDQVRVDTEDLKRSQREPQGENEKL